MLDYKTVVNWPARCLTAFIHILSHIFISLRHHTVDGHNPVNQLISQLSPLICYSTLYSHPYGSRVCTSKAWLLEFDKGLKFKTRIYTRNDSNDEIAHSGNPYNE